jgi:Fic family protein
MYLWEQPDWTEFRWASGVLLRPLGEARAKQGKLLGRMAGFGFDLRLRSHLDALTEEAVKTSEIEGERLDALSVRSSIARRLGVQDAAAGREDRRVEGVVDMLLDATQHHEMALTAERLIGWHAALFPTGFSGLHKVKVGDYRDGPIDVVSGPIGRHRVPFEAPPAERVASEMARFLAWFGTSAQDDGLLRAGIAHLWFVTIHPFDDGNGRIARAITDMALAQDEAARERFYSLSRQIRIERADYYNNLERTQRGDNDITAWLLWFVGCFARAIDGATDTLASVLEKARFWARHGAAPLTERQRRVLNRFLDGFEGKLTAKKWAVIGKCSVPTAQRDIAELVGLGILVRNAGGSKNTSYSLPVT